MNERKLCFITEDIIKESSTEDIQDLISRLQTELNERDPLWEDFLIGHYKTDGTENTPLIKPESKL